MSDLSRLGLILAMGVVAWLFILWHSNYSSPAAVAKRRAAEIKREWNRRRR